MNMQHTHFASLRPLAASLALLLAACGGGGSGGNTATAPDASAQAATFSIGGSASGLKTGNEVVLQNNGGDDLAVPADGNFAFATAVTGPYAVTIGRQPLWQDCTVANGSGTAAADVTSVSVSCTPYAAYVTTVAGSAGVYGPDDGTGAAAAFSEPAQVAIDASGNFYVGDIGNGLRKVTPAGVVTTVASGLNGPWGVAIGPDGNIYVALLGDNKILKVTPAGTITTFAGSGTAVDADGNGTSASFNMPSGLAFDRTGNLYVAEIAGSIRRITPAGDVTTLAGTGVPGTAVDGVGTAATFGNLYGLAIDHAGVLYVPDFSNQTIRKVLPDGTVSTFAGTGAARTDDGPIATATFAYPISIALGPDGALYVGDYSPGTVRRISRTGFVSTLAGNGTTSGSADGPATSVATLSGPTGLAFDANGTLYFSDYNYALFRKLGRP
jgi:sugar lactone lactonase YvrE